MRRVKLAVAAAVVIAAAVATAAAVWPSGAKHHHATQVDSALGAPPGGGTNFCFSRPTGSKDWARVAKLGVEFGLDQVVLTPASGQVTVTKAELINPKGGIRLIKAVFAPYAAFAIGFIGEDFGLPPFLADKIQELPATLTSTPKPAGAPPDWDPAYWQLAIVVSAPLTSSDASATGVKLTYRSGSTERTHYTVGGVRLMRPSCPARGA